MAKPLVRDDLPAVIAPLLPRAHPRPKGRRPPIPDRAARTGILFVLRTGLPWEYQMIRRIDGSGPGHGGRRLGMNSDLFPEDVLRSCHDNVGDRRSGFVSNPHAERL